MVDEREIWVRAHHLLKEHGHDAWFVASERADALLAEGQMDGHRTFMRILDRIKQLEQFSPVGHVH